MLEVEAASPSTKCFAFKDKVCAQAKPGQFLMLWIPGIDEIPLSVLNVTRNGAVSVAVEKPAGTTIAGKPVRDARLPLFPACPFPIVETRVL